jgi:hypothetical protein
MRGRSILVTGVVALGVVGSVAAALTVVPAGNLVKNPGAEGNAGATAIFDYRKPAGWVTEGTNSGKGEVGEKGITVVQYQRAYMTPDFAAAIGGGKNFFAGGQDVSPSTATQMIDVSRAAAEIDSGGVKACMSAYLGGFRDEADTARVDLEFLSADGVTLGQLRIGPVTRGQRKSQTTLLRRAAQRAVPADTRQLKVVLTAESPERGNNFGFADNISVGFTNGSCDPVLTVKCVNKALVATVTPSTAHKVQRVRFAVKGGKRTKQVNDARAPYSARFPMTGFTGRLAVTATVTHAGSGTAVLKKASKRC